MHKKPPLVKSDTKEVFRENSNFLVFKAYADCRETILSLLAAGPHKTIDLVGLNVDFNEKVSFIQSEIEIFIKSFCVEGDFFVEN
jgi:hypothetical protein